MLTPLTTRTHIRRQAVVIGPSVTSYPSARDHEREVAGGWRFQTCSARGGTDPGTQSVCVSVYVGIVVGEGKRGIHVQMCVNKDNISTLQLSSGYVINVCSIYGQLCNSRNFYHGIRDHMSFTCLIPTHIVDARKCPDELKVLWAVDISVLHELEVLLVHAALDLCRHCVQEHVSSLSFLYQSLVEGDGGGEYRQSSGTFIKS